MEELKRVAQRRITIGIDALSLGNPKDGSQTYVRNLIRELGRLDTTNDYALLLPPSLETAAVPGGERMRRVIVGKRTSRLRLPFATSRAVARAGLDLLHVQFAAPLYCPPRIVVTVHDIMYEHYPQFFNPSDLRQLRLRVPLTLRRAAAVLTGSEFCKRDISRRYNVPADKIVVAPYAADPMFQPIEDAARLDEVRARYATGPRYILFVGVLKPNKNVKTLVEAYVRLRQAGRVRHRLVLVGQQELLYGEMFARAREAGLAGDLVFTGRVSDQDLVALYNAAELFVQPSLFEGFGLPSLEAMACGTPVVTSNTAAIPEVVGDAALTVDPLDVEALAGAIATVLDDDDVRRRMAARSIERAAMFSWEAAARAALGVYQRVARA